ncbi:hypothetical protein M8494_19045 [Serratia ureilytica]
MSQTLDSAQLLAALDKVMVISHHRSAGHHHLRQRSVLPTDRLFPGRAGGPAPQHRAPPFRAESGLQSDVGHYQGGRHLDGIIRTSAKAACCT